MLRILDLPSARSFLLLLATAVLGACSADGDATSLRGERSGAAPTGEAPPGAPPGVEAPAAAFEYAAQIQLLPFDVRLAKVAHVVGVAVEDPLFDTLRARRLELGDHDYAKGLKPDLGWTSSRMGIWVRALKPVCASSAFRERYASFPEALDTFTLAAFGRAATDDDRQALAETVGTTALDSETQHRLTCLALLSSLEFVAR